MKNDGIGQFQALVEDGAGADDGVAGAGLLPDPGRGVGRNRLDLPERSCVSDLLGRAKSRAAASGLSTPTDSTPNSNAPMQHGSRNCQAEMPAERAMTSSYLRLSDTSVAIAENRPTNGTVCSMIIGTRSAEISKRRRDR